MTRFISCLLSMSCTSWISEACKDCSREDDRAREGISSAGEVREAALLLLFALAALALALALALAAAEKAEDDEEGLADFVDIGILS